MDIVKLEIDRLVKEHNFIPFYWNGHPKHPDARSRKEYPNYTINAGAIEELHKEIHSDNELGNWIADQCRYSLKNVIPEHINVILEEGYKKGYRVHDMRQQLEKFYPFCKYSTNCSYEDIEDITNNFIDNLNEDEWEITATDNISGDVITLPSETDWYNFDFKAIKARNAEEAVYETIHRLYDNISHDMAFFIAEGGDVYLDNNSLEILGPEDDVSDKNILIRNGKPIYTKLEDFFAINKRTNEITEIKNPAFLG